MLFLLGWGKNAKKIGYLGISKCKNCKNYTHLYIYEIANNINIYFIPVAKFNRKYIVACELCKAGIEITPETKNNLIEKYCSIMAPPEETVRIWNTIRDKISDLLVEYSIKLNSNKFNKNNLDIELKQRKDKIMQEVKETTMYKLCVEIIYEEWLQSINDEDNPE